jgi:hypothetical protein
MVGMRSSGVDEKEGEIPYRADFFHIVFALASMYIAMLVSAKAWLVSLIMLARSLVGISLVSTPSPCHCLLR